MRKSSTLLVIWEIIQNPMRWFFKFWGMAVFRKMDINNYWGNYEELWSLEHYSLEK